MVTFMVHDRWSDVLFVHWKVPSHLEECLIDAIPSSFMVDRYPCTNSNSNDGKGEVDQDQDHDEQQQQKQQQEQQQHKDITQGHGVDGGGDVWIGLVLLTEEQVGPSIGRTRWTCLTHHGVNVRTYIRGCCTSRKQDRRLTSPLSTEATESTTTTTKTTTTIGPQGIHFFSLECSDEFTSWGANKFGMPYRVADIIRRQGPRGRRQENNNNSNDDDDDDITNQQFYVSSTRSQNDEGRPSIVRAVSRTIQSVITATVNVVYNRLRLVLIRHRLLPSRWNSSNDKEQPLSRLSSSSTTSKPVSSTPSSFSVECQWTVVDQNGNDENTYRNDDQKLAEWLMERYHVYTNKYGLDWIGSISHETWPTTTTTTMQAIRLDRMDILSIDTYQPRSIRPILEYMSKTRPDSVLFSPGVGPIKFQMLQPVHLHGK